jgi:hypothetical protein
VKACHASNPTSILYLKLFICLFVLGFTLYAFIVKGNQVTEMRLAVPALAKKVRMLQEENSRLQYEIEQFENPIHLMEMKRKPELSHLKFPYVEEILILPEPLPLGEKNE